MSSSLKTTAEKLCNKVLEKFDPKVVNIFDSWLETWTKYLDQESNFTATDLVQYNPGDIISVCLGFNVGSEQGGNRPAIVIGKNSRSNKTILIVPLGSYDKTKGLKKSEISLGELAEFNKETGHAEGTESKVLLGQIRTISKQRIIKPKTRHHTKLNIGTEKLKFLEDELINLIKS